MRRTKDFKVSVKASNNGLGSAQIDRHFGTVLGNACEHHPQTFAVYCRDAYRRNHFLGFFLAVFAASLKSAADGAAFVPGLFIFSPDPAFILALLAWIFEYKPGLVFTFDSNLDS